MSVGGLQIVYSAQFTVWDDIETVVTFENEDASLLYKIRHVRDNSMAGEDFSVKIDDNSTQGYIDLINFKEHKKSGMTTYPLYIASVDDSKGGFDKFYLLMTVDYQGPMRVVKNNVELRNFTRWHYGVTILKQPTGANDEWQIN
jgi:hypothetical protein